MAQLPVPFRASSVPGRILALYKYDAENIFGDLDSFSRQAVSEFGFTKRNIFTRLLLISSLLTRKDMVAILEHLCIEEIISKQKVLALYGSQTSAVRQEKPFLLIQDMYRFKSGASKLRMFSDIELVELASKVVSISQADAEFFMCNDHLLSKFPIEVLLRWVDGEGSTLSMLNRARLAKQLLDKGDTSITVEILTEGLRESAATEPASGAVQLFFTLLYSFKGVRSRKGRDKARDTLASVLLMMILPTGSRPTVAVFEGQELLGWYLTNPMIDKTDKDWMEMEIKPSTDAIAKIYANFIADAKKSSPLAIT